MLDLLRRSLLALVLVGCGAGAPMPDAAAPDAALTDAAVGPPVWNDFLVESGDVTLHVWTYGGHDGSPVMLLLSGGPGFSHDYMTAFAGYASPELRLVWFDQRGTGMSTAPTTTGYAIADQVADIEAVRAAVGAEQLHIVGHSWGGGYALFYLVAQPAQVASIVLIDNLAPDWTAFQAGQARFTARLRELQAAGVIPDPLPSSVGDDCLPPDIAMFPAYLADPATLPPQEIQETTSHCAPRNGTFVVINGYDLRPQLGGARAPIAIIFGSADPFGLDWQTQTEAALPMATLTTTTIEGSGHFPWFEQPEPFEVAFRAFLGAQGLELGSE
jgi:pimeloyl-ACP methyl ester carboxylesterase